LHLLNVWRTLIAFAVKRTPRQVSEIVASIPVNFTARAYRGACTHPKKDRMKNIYVGNLDFNVTEDELRQAFAAYGQVDNVTILKDRDTGQPRGFGFVEMANDEEAEKAINGINGTQLGSRALNVNEPRPKVSKGGFGGGGGGGRGGYGGGRGGNRGGGGGGYRRY
jgi:cold-inducible RNA-binding protein